MAAGAARVVPHDRGLAPAQRGWASGSTACACPTPPLPQRAAGACPASGARPGAAVPHAAGRHAARGCGSSRVSESHNPHVEPPRKRSDVRAARRAARRSGSVCRGAQHGGPRIKAARRRWHAPALCASAAGQRARIQQRRCLAARGCRHRRCRGCLPALILVWPANFFSSGCSLHSYCLPCCACAYNASLAFPKLDWALDSIQSHCSCGRAGAAVPRRRRSARHSAPGCSVAGGAHAASVAAQAIAAAAAESAPTSVGTGDTAAAALAPAAAEASFKKPAQVAQSGALVSGATAAPAHGAAGVGVAGRAPGAQPGASARTAAAAPLRSRLSSPLLRLRCCLPLLGLTVPSWGLLSHLRSRRWRQRASSVICTSARTAPRMRREPPAQSAPAPAAALHAGQRRRVMPRWASRRSRRHQAAAASGVPARLSPDENDARTANALGADAKNPAGLGSCAPASAPRSRRRSARCRTRAVPAMLAARRRRRRRLRSRARRRAVTRVRATAPCARPQARHMLHDASRPDEHLPGRVPSRPQPTCTRKAALLLFSRCAGVSRPQAQPRPRR